MSEEANIIVHNPDLTPRGAMQKASNIASVCKEIVMKTAMTIQGRKYVKVEGWLALAQAAGYTIGTRDVEKVDGGIRAMADVRRISDGAVIATAEGFVGDDERMWSGRPLYARRAMAQTRATSRACRNALAFIVVMIDENMGTTPAEEMEGTDQVAKSDNAETEEDFLKGRVQAYRDAKTPTQRARALVGLTPEQSKHVETQGKGGEPHAA